MSTSSPTVILVVGMAGTGKTTLVHLLQHYATSRQRRAYYINLDPAVTNVPYHANIDIRDTVNYHEVMSSYSLGPNGAILTSLNLFATKMHQVIALLEQKKASLDWIVVDTPGQIEVFTWSASGQLIAEALASSFTTVILFVADTTRCVQPHTFMSTMLYASGIMLKQQLPLIVAFNKTDVMSATIVQEWMHNSDALEDAMALAQNGTSTSYHTPDAAGDESYLSVGASVDLEHTSSLVRSISLFMHEFYENIVCVAVAAICDTGIDALDDALTTAAASAYMADRASAAQEHISANTLHNNRCCTHGKAQCLCEATLHTEEQMRRFGDDCLSS